MCDSAVEPSACALSVGRVGLERNMYKGRSILCKVHLSRSAHANDDGVRDARMERLQWRVKTSRVNV